MAKIKMANLVNAIVELNPKELQELARGLPGVPPVLAIKRKSWSSFSM